MFRILGLLQDDAQLGEVPKVDAVLNFIRYLQAKFWNFSIAI